MNPVTGRKHQLRKQLSLIVHPIYGDNKYTFEISISDNKYEYNFALLLEKCIASYKKIFKFIR